MQLRKRVNGLLMATQAEEDEAQRWLEEGRRAVKHDIIKQLRLVNKLVAKGRYKNALLKTRELVDSLLELEMYY